MPSLNFWIRVRNRSALRIRSNWWSHPELDLRQIYPFDVCTSPSSARTEKLGTFEKSTMLIHLASYPRSGNSLVQQIIHDYLGRPTSTIFDRKPAKLERYINNEVPTIRNWRQPSARQYFTRGLLSRFDPLPDWLASFDLTLPSGDVISQKYLLPGCPEILNPSNRKRLARMDSTFFVKTHWRPYESYFEGEFIILR